MQYFYIVGDDLTMCKIGLNPHQLTKWGRSYKLYRQSITQTGKITFYKQLKSYATEVEVAKEGFDWDAFEASRGADMVVDNLGAKREASLEQGVRENCLVNQETIKFILMRLDEIPSNSCTLLGIYLTH